MDVQLQSPTRKALIFIIVTVILDTLGLTIVAPVAPFLVARYVVDPSQVGAAVGWFGSMYAICQFAAASGLGILSDRYGRKPILLLCLLGSALGYLLLGLGGALWVLFLGRIIDGLTGANTSIIIAYISDVVPAPDRGKYFGWIGAVGAACVVLGPAAGGLLAKFGYGVPFYLAGVVTFINLLYGLFSMPESLLPAQRIDSIVLIKLNPLSTLAEVFKMSQLRLLLATSFLYTLASIIIPSNLGLMSKDSLHWDADAMGALFSVFGVASIVVQGLLLPWLLKHSRARIIAIVGLGFAAMALMLIAFITVIPSTTLLYFAMIIFALGEGLVSPTLLDLITRQTDAQTQGKVQGGNQSVQSLANVVGPVVAGELYDRVGHALPYLGSAGLVLFAAGMIASTSRSLSTDARQSVKG